MHFKTFFVFILLLSIYTVKSQDINYYAFDIQSNTVKLHGDMKTILIVIPNVYCSGCVKEFSSFFMKIIKQKKKFVLLILVEGYEKNVLFNRKSISSFSNLFPSAQGIYFEFPDKKISKEERKHQNLTSYFHSNYLPDDFPLIVLIDKNQSIVLQIHCI